MSAAAPASGPLAGIRVVELASDHAAYAAKLLSDLGADVVVVEPRGGHPSRSYGPFAGQTPDPDRSLWWWYYNTSKRSVELDLETEEGRAGFRRLVEGADIVIEGEPVDRLGHLGVDHTDVLAVHPELIWVSVTPFGRHGERANEPATDLTLLAAGGIVWNCGYDDHEIPPVRGRGNQAAHIAGVFAANAALTALLGRDMTSRGQHVDVSMYAAVNVTTESGSFVWLVSEKVIERQTGRHAGSAPTLPTQVLAADGRYVTTGFPPHAADDFRSIVEWMEQLGIKDEFGDTVLLGMAIEQGGIDYRRVTTDPLVAEMYAAGREALCFIASRVTAHEFFVGAQERDMQCGIIYSPDEALDDRHTIERGFPVEVEHPELGASFRYPGAPFKLSASPWSISRRPPLVGEHNALLESGDPFGEGA